MRSYRQYCPIARGAEVFAERWTPIIVRNLQAGCETFGQILEGAPASRGACRRSGFGCWSATASWSEARAPAERSTA